ncbi:MAG TPA: ATP-binding protein [Acidimicrobiia bacterium]
MPIRIRLALAAAALTLVLFAVAWIVFVDSFRHGRVESLDQGLAPQAASLRRDLRAGKLSLGRAGSVPTREVVAQVLDTDGNVVKSTNEAGPDPVITRDIVRAVHKEGRVFTERALGPEPETFRIIAIQAMSPKSQGENDRIVVVGTSLEETHNAVNDVERFLLISAGVAVVVVGIGAWFLAGAALRPVERMRRQADAISDRDVDARLVVPHSRDEIARLGRTMNRLLERLQGSLGRQRNFVADAGHELRTPISVLQTELELAGRPGRTEQELREAISHATRETLRLGTLADELLFLARSDVVQSARSRRTPQRVVEAIERSVEAFNGRAAEAGVRIAVESDPTLQAPLDTELLRRGLDNLLDNALRYGPAGSTVTVTAAQTGPGWVAITVADEGPGFPQTFLPHAFERFRRASDARGRDDGGGSGLGLAIALAVAEAHGGTATAANRSVGGAIVTLRLPANTRGG